jgi:myo-inositol-1(or 4)-monophosphatase
LPVTDLDLLIVAARKAGDIAADFFKSAPKVWDKPAGQGPVTEADLAVDTMLRETLTAVRPCYGWLSEETHDTSDRLSTTRQFIIDPIDGTRAFIDGSKDWAHSLAIVENGQVIAGVVYLPMKDQMFAAWHGEGATLNGETLHIEGTATPPTILTNTPTMDVTNWKNAQPPKVDRHFRSSLAYRMCLVAEGRFDGMITLRPSWEWDIAAGALILTEAGGTVTDKKGVPLRFNNPHPQVNGVIGAVPTFHKTLTDQLL